MQGRKVAWIALILVALFALPQVWAGGAEESKGKAVTIGVSVGDLRLERWKRDLDYMVQHAIKIGAAVFATSSSCWSPPSSSP